MIDYEVDRYILKRDQTLIEAMEIITKNRQGIGFVCENYKLVAALSDGDIRRKLIRSNSLNSSVDSAANYNPHYVNYEEKDTAEKILYEEDLAAVPLVDKQKHIIAVVVKEILENKTGNPIGLPVIIMAGGKGSRLMPYTNVLPKPLIPIGNKTILERIINQFTNVGCSDFGLIINYKKELLKAYLNEIPHDYKVEFYEENEFLGTAGGLKLLEDRIRGTFFMSNCDILVDCNYHKLLEKHQMNKNILTIVCVKKEIVVPYGVLETDKLEKNVIGIKEKPAYQALINTGFYVVESEFLKYIPSNTYADITDALRIAINQGEKVGMYVIEEEQWLDMGQFSEIEKMKNRVL